MTFFRPFWAIARATLTEAMQQPIAMLLFLTALVVTTMAPVLELHHFGESGRLARDSGLASMLFFGFVLALFAAGRSVANEIEGGTAAAILAKPVQRGVFLVAKFAGVAMLLALFWGTLLFNTLLAERASEHIVETADSVTSMIDSRTTKLSLLAPVAVLVLSAWRHFRRNKRFGVTLFAALPIVFAILVAVCGFWHVDGHWQSHKFDLNMRVLPAALLIYLALVVCAAMAIFLATFCTANVTVVVGLALSLLGLSGDMLVSRTSIHKWWQWFGLIVGGLLPNMQNFWQADALARGGQLPWGYIGSALVMAVVWIAAALLAGAIVLERREIG